MAVLDSTSTTADIEAAYADNAGYLEDADPAMARRFITACEFMLRRGGLAAYGIGSQNSQYRPDNLEKSIARANKFIAGQAGVSAGGAGVLHTSFEDFRT